MTDNALVHSYLQYSKRIAIFGVTQWAIIALCVLALVVFSITTAFSLDEQAGRVVMSIISSSSAIAIAAIGGYYAHSAYDNYIKKKVGQAIDADGYSASDGEGNG